MRLLRTACIGFVTAAAMGCGADGQLTNDAARPDDAAFHTPDASPADDTGAAGDAGATPVDASPDDVGTDVPVMPPNDAATAPSGLRSDTTFGASGVLALNGSALDSWSATSCAVADDGAIVLAGSADNSHALFARVTATGALDTTFGTMGAVTGFAGHARGVHVLADGRVVALVGGDQVVRLTSVGAPDPTFDTDGIAASPQAVGRVEQLDALAVRPDGVIVAGGWIWSTVLDHGHDFYFVQYNANGSFDTTFASGGRLQRSIATSTDESVSTLAFDRDLRVTFGGASGTALVLGRLTLFGAPDASFGTDGVVYPAMQSGSVALFALTDSSLLHVSDLRVSRFLPTGAVDSTFAGGGPATSTYCQFSGAVARGPVDFWASCANGNDMRGFDWSGSPLAPGVGTVVMPAVRVAGVDATVAVNTLCAGARGEVVAVGDVTEPGTRARRGVFVARFANAR